MTVNTPREWVSGYSISRAQIYKRKEWEVQLGYEPTSFPEEGGRWMAAQCFFISLSARASATSGTRGPEACGRAVTEEGGTRAAGLLEKLKDKLTDRTF